MKALLISLLLMVGCGGTEEIVLDPILIKATVPENINNVHASYRPDGMTITIDGPYVIEFYDIALWFEPTLSVSYTAEPGQAPYTNPDCTSCDNGHPNITTISVATTELTNQLDWTWNLDGHGRLVTFPAWGYGQCIGNVPGHLMVTNTQTGFREFWNVCGDRLTNDNVTHPGEIVWTNRPLDVIERPAKRCRPKCELVETRQPPTHDPKDTGKLKN